MLKELKISCQEFADKMDMSVNGVYNWKKRGLGSSVINKIVKVFPQVNVEWLLTGNGEILKATEAATRPFIPTGIKLHDDIIEQMSDFTLKGEQQQPGSPYEIIMDIYSRCVNQLKEEREVLKEEIEQLRKAHEEMQNEIKEIRNVKDLLHDAVYALRTASDYSRDTHTVASEPIGTQPNK